MSSVLLFFIGVVLSEEFLKISLILPSTLQYVCTLINHETMTTYKMNKTEDFAFSR